MPDRRTAPGRNGRSRSEILADAGVDLLVCESFGRLDEARLALACCRKTALPVVVSMDVALPDGRLNNPLLGDDEVTADGVAPAECARTLAGDGADVVGGGGIREPEDLWPVVLEMREAVDTCRLPSCRMGTGRAGRTGSTCGRVCTSTGWNWVSTRIKRLRTISDFWADPTGWSCDSFVRWPRHWTASGKHIELRPR